MAAAKEDGIHDHAMEFNDNSAGMLAGGKKIIKICCNKYINMTILNLQELMCV